MFQTGIFIGDVVCHLGFIKIDGIEYSMFHVAEMPVNQDGVLDGRKVRWYVALDSKNVKHCTGEPLIGDVKYFSFSVNGGSKRGIRGNFKRLETMEEYYDAIERKKNDRAAKRYKNKQKE